jgi:hypothetical protein
LPPAASADSGPIDEIAGTRGRLPRSSSSALGFLIFNRAFDRPDFKCIYGERPLELRYSKKRNALEPNCDQWAAPSYALMSPAITRIPSGYDCLQQFWWDMFSFLATTGYVITSRSELSLMLHRDIVA